MNSLNMETTRNLRLLATGILLAGTVSVLHAQGSGFVNDICVPDKMYMFAALFDETPR